jgi:hypothetical protein
MKYYKGECPQDIPINGGSGAAKAHTAQETFNFDPVVITDENVGTPEEWCLGFVETKSANKNAVNQLHIEKIEGCQALTKEEAADDVLVVWCAKETANSQMIVGWYKHANVFRNHQYILFKNQDGTETYVEYNISAKAEDCVLLPKGIRHRKLLWDAPRVSAKGRNYGFGQSPIWYVNDIDKNEHLKAYIDKLLEQIDNYDGENWLYQYPGAEN